MHVQGVKDGWLTTDIMDHIFLLLGLVSIICTTFITWDHIITLLETRSLCRDDSSNVERSPSRLQAQSTPNQSQSTLSLLSVPVKIINPDKKSEAKRYMLRNVDKENLESLTDFKDMIFNSLGRRWLAVS